MTNKTKLWIDAANFLAENPQAIVTCPECKIGKLKTKDETIEGWDKIDRNLICDTCGCYNVVTMPKQ